MFSPALEGRSQHNELASGGQNKKILKKIPKKNY